MGEKKKEVEGGDKKIFLCWLTAQRAAQIEAQQLTQTQEPPCRCRVQRPWASLRCWKLGGMWSSWDSSTAGDGQESTDSGMDWGTWIRVDRASCVPCGVD